MSLSRTHNTILYVLLYIYYMNRNQPSNIIYLRTSRQQPTEKTLCNSLNLFGVAENLLGLLSALSMFVCGWVED